MNRLSLAGTVLLLTFSAAYAAQSPEFKPLAIATHGKSALDDSGTIRRPQAHVVRAATVSEMRVVPDANGGLKLQCTDVPNPRLRTPQDRTISGGPRQ
ncbi:hypothetical protein DFR29_107296 [Tahibacter aquaticus]|uniref:Uncharacterized protein n=1 Tax=Tahibacter aquaticus TaxID=520092 RepID=A0A4R6YWS2_9GAMM|nr:hypothetical protein [Tahibacter aquaticus]TDR43283.1 hypothetical protein DFR29_107296 [Tahibacter aquaticus]